MGRPRAFDEQAVLEAAGETFWVQGYEGTSTRDLTACTGLTPSSMYTAFGDKRTLFRLALDSYLDRTLRAKIARFEAYPSPGLAITTFFDEIIAQSTNDNRNRGCLLVNSALGASPRDSEFQKAIADELAMIERFFHRRILAAQRTGEISAVHPADDAARLLFSILLGIRVLARVRPERELLAGSVRPALAMLGLPALPSEAGASGANS